MTMQKADGTPRPATRKDKNTDFPVKNKKLKMLKIFACFRKRKQVFVSLQSKSALSSNQCTEFFVLLCKSGSVHNQPIMKIFLSFYHAKSVLSHLQTDTQNFQFTFLYTCMQENHNDRYALFAKNPKGQICNESQKIEVFCLFAI